MSNFKLLFFAIYGPYLLAGLVLVVLVVLLFLRIKKRRQQVSAGVKVQEEKAVKVKKLSRARLAKVWKGFLRGIPWNLRMTVKVYQHFIVLGEPGSGKTGLIDRQTDWQGHARQFYPSYTKSPLLQIYLGSKVLVQEIPSDLLNDSTPEARRALVKLWRPLFRRKDPTIVIVINGSMFAERDRDSLKKEAQNVRGKINLLSRIRRRPVKVRIALTHMDQYLGFSEFSDFLTRNRIPLRLGFDSKEELKDIATCLDPFEDYLARALTDLNADDYLRAISFIKDAPRLFQGLSIYLDFLQSSDPLSREPVVTGLYLVSQDEGKKGAANPFATTLTAEALQKFNPLLKHKITAIALGLLGIFFLGGAYLYEYRLIEGRYLEIAALEEAPPARYNDRMHRLFVDPVTHIQRNTMMSFFPDFFPDINSKLNARCIENIRQHYLIPELQRFSSGAVASSSLAEIQKARQQHEGDIEDAQDKVLYLLGLIHATRDNELGKLIRGNLKQWTEILDLPSVMIEDYVNNNRSTEGLDLQIDQYMFDEAATIASDPHSLMVYFVNISRLYGQSTVSKSDFKKIQKETTSFLKLINQLERYDLSSRVSDLLKKESSLGFSLDLIAKEESQLTQQQIKFFLQFVKQSSIDIPEVKDAMTLAELRENIRVMLHFNQESENTDVLYHFIFGGEEFKLSEKKWNELIDRSRITYFLQDFMRKNKYNDGLLFFSDEQEFDDLVMNSSNDGRFLFTGSGRVDGRYTREAVDQRVRPLLTEIPTFIQQLPIQQVEKDRFLNFLFREVEAYAQQYSESYLNYYLEFAIKADSLGALDYVLRQMTLPSSQFVNVLQTVKENTFVDPKENRYLYSISLSLAPFEFFQRLMEEKKGTYPELDTYRALLEQMQAELQNAPLVASDESLSREFERRLSPVGKISLSILRDDPDSYLNLVRNWVNSVGIAPAWADVFLAPVWQAYTLGVVEIEEEIAAIWSDLYRTDIAPLSRRFPFDTSASKDVAVEDLICATHSEGHFSKEFKALLAPVLIQDSDGWRERPSELDALRLPADLLPTVNAVFQLSTLLWDEQGEARPLEFMIKPAPLPALNPDKPIALLSFLSAGTAPVFSFNQQPAWKKFTISWQEEREASVGVEFALNEDGERAQEGITIPKTMWSFFHLIKRVKNFENMREEAVTGIPTLLTWEIASPDMHSSDGLPSGLGDRQEISFAMQGNPWGIFTLSKEL
jgi:hypothetical protein